MFAIGDRVWAEAEDLMLAIHDAAYKEGDGPVAAKPEKSSLKSWR